MASDKTGISFENVEKFVAALSTMPTKAILRELVNQTSIKAVQRIALRPAPTGATAGTSGKHSTGNIKTPQRLMYARGGNIASHQLRNEQSMPCSTTLAWISPHILWCTKNKSALGASLCGVARAQARATKID